MAFQRRLVYQRNFYVVKGDLRNERIQLNQRNHRNQSSQAKFCGTNLFVSKSKVYETSNGHFSLTTTCGRPTIKQRDSLAAKTECRVDLQYHRSAQPTSDQKLEYGQPYFGAIKQANRQQNQNESISWGRLRII